VADWFSWAVRKFVQEVFRKNWYVFGTFPERRKRDPNDIEAKVEVLAELLLVGQQFQVLVRGRHQPDLYLGIHVAAQSLNHSAFDGP
jgi:hypothetical protein